MTTYPTDGFLAGSWPTAGTGSAILIISSSRRRRAVGLEEIHFFWYARKIGLHAVGYFAGIFVYIAQHKLLH